MFCAVFFLSDDHRRYPSPILDSVSAVLKSAPSGNSSSVAAFKLCNAFPILPTAILADTKTFCELAFRLLPKLGFFEQFFKQFFFFVFC